MTSDPHNLSGAYALDALDAAERDAYESHLAECSDCAEEVRGFRATAARLGAAEETHVPEHLRRTVLDAVARTPQERPVVVDLASHPRTRWATRALLVAASLALVVGAAVFGVTQRDRADDMAAQQEAITAVLSAPDAAMVSSPVEGGGTVRVLQSAELAKAVMVVSDLPKLAEDEDYQMWTQSDGAMHSAGVLPRDEQGSRGAHVMDDVTGVTAVAISIEPAGGSEEPTSDPIVLIETT
ncbi:MULTISPECIES: anti-sigma factor [Mumia]|uniref:Regulator of SigK n=1 Tax=Mumia xiangluensis TaxID=1678900 RepID=A0ABW1QKK5_9ACTN|nr:MULTISPECIES: anti-sigma factor [Mumia]